MSQCHSCFSMGLNTLKVPMKLYKDNRDRLISKLGNKGVVFVEGGKQKTRDATDNEPLFRQESYFHWLFGVSEPDCYAAINVATQKSTLFVPYLPVEYAVWMGEIKQLAEFKDKYEVDEVRFVDDIEKYFQENNPETIFVIEGLNHDSGAVHPPAHHDALNNYSVDKKTLHPIISECRVFKTELELEVLKYSARVSSEAHVHCMKNVKPGMMEYQVESLFTHYCYYNGGCRNVSYTCICGTGKNSAVLHYGHAGAPNDKLITDGDMCLFDMGSEYHCYGSDITCSYPANGKFTAEQNDIYSAVLAAQKAVYSKLKPGVSWVDMHLTAELASLTVLKERGYLQGDLDEMQKQRVGALFQPHGLGHLLGIDTHDVGGYGEHFPERLTEAGLKKLRTSRIVEKGMYLTVEPGVYFIKVLLEPAFDDPVLGKFLVKEKIQPLMSFGGIRLEDDVAIIEDGYVNFTKCPREISDIEAVMAGATWDFDTCTVTK